MGDHGTLVTLIRDLLQHMPNMYSLVLGPVSVMIQEEELRFGGLKCTVALLDEIMSDLIKYGLLRIAIDVQLSCFEGLGHFCGRLLHRAPKLQELSLATGRGFPPDELT